MPANYVLLEKITVGAAGASSVTFSGIPQTGYTDLVIKASVREASTSSFTATIQFNGSTTNYSQRNLQGDGSAASSGTTTAIEMLINGSSTTASTFGNAEIYIPNYTSSNYKSVSIDSVTETNATTVYMRMGANLWSNTAAITSIAIAISSGNIAQYSTFYLYGVAKLGTTPAIVPYATGGDTIMTDGTYWYHTFISSGTFTPAKALTCDYLVVAGGGGAAGAGGGGGGGAGGLRSTVTATGGGGSLESAISLGASAYTVTVGGGGAGTNSNGVDGVSGSNSVFATITSTGGGGGAAIGLNGVNGGSGGGVGRDSTTARTGGTATSGQGYRGGNGAASSSSYAAAGGGGGAGAVGGNGSITGGPGTPPSGDGGNGGNGGNGVAVAISGSSVTYAGGGGGALYNAGSNTFSAGTGGSGGGGAGGKSAAGTSGTANTGGGGGGGRDYTGGNGGSGIVIVRYAV